MKIEDKKRLAIGISLLVVLGFLGGDLTRQFAPNLPGQILALVEMKQGVSDTPAVQAWQIFTQYRQYAKDHNLAGLKSLTHKLSPICQAALDGDTTKVKECEGLMDSVYFFTQDFEFHDFSQASYDDKQLILATDYRKLTDDTDPIKVVIYFVRNGPAMQMLGLRFCFGTEGSGSACVVTRADQRDKNNNGWWDDIEYFF